MKNISGTIADALWTQGIIQKDEVAACKYGIDIFISSFLEIASILLIAAVLGNFFETVLLFLAFIPLRVYAGGYHADTKLKCYIISLMMYAIAYVIAAVLPSETYLFANVFGTLFSLFTVLIKAPIIHRNKTVNAVERKNYRKISIEICLFETTAVLLLTSKYPQNSAITYLAVGQMSVSISMLAAVAKNHIIGK